MLRLFMFMMCSPNFWSSTSVDFWKHCLLLKIELLKLELSQKNQNNPPPPKKTKDLVETVMFQFKH